MRNDLQDEPENIPSLHAQVDEYEVDEPVSTKMSKAQHSKKLTGFQSFILLLSACMFLAAVAVLYVVVRQGSDNVREQLDTESKSQFSAIETTKGQLQTLIDQAKQQEKSLKTETESFKQQLKQLSAKLTALESAQQKIVVAQNTLTQKLAVFEKTAAENVKFATQFKQLDNEINVLKKNQVSADSAKALTTDIQALKKQDLGQVIKGLQDDIFLLRSQQEIKPAASGVDAKALEALKAKLERDMQAVEGQIKDLKIQLDNRPIY